jgi:ABC-type antimicrobial peptide transport system permease subunit
MLKNYFSVAIRNFLRQGFFSFLNVAGLAVGLATTFVIYLWINDEISKDKFHADINRIHHVVLNLNNPEGTITWQVTPGPLAEAIKTGIPEIEYVAHIANDGPRLFQYKELTFLPNGYFTDPDFFKIFSYKIIAGDASNPLPNPSSIVLTNSLAKKLFGSEDPIGKIVNVRSENDLMVTAIMEDLTDQSSMQFEFIAHFDVHKKYRQQDWGNSDYPLFFKFRDADFNIKETQQKINDHVAKILELNDEDKKRLTYYIQPFADRYLYSSFENGFPVNGRIKYVQIFSVVALFILMVACINFMNMATARATVRHKEIGVRKSVGAQRWSLTLQFIGESILVSALSMLLAIGIAEITLPFFNTLVDKQISIHYLQPEYYLPIIIIVLFTGMLAGFYPALILSAVNPISALKGASVSVTKGVFLRKALVVFQFAISVVLIISSLVMYKQIDFIQSKHLGYDKENVIIFPGRGIKDFTLFKDQLSRIKGVSSASMANESLIEIPNQNSSFSWMGKPENSRLYVRTLVVGYDFMETMNFTLVEGRFFSEAMNDTANVIINKKLASLMNVQNPIGLTINQWGKAGKIVGVVEDFHGRSLSEAMDPFVLLCYPEWTGNFYVRVEPGRTQDVLSSLEMMWKTVSPQFPFEYTFLDSQYEKLYKQEQVIGKLAAVFTCMAIFISSLGLLGLAAYATERKKKEISIRKVLGATVTELIAMMSKEFVMLTCLALLVGCPIAYYFMQSFLQGYAYHVELGYMIFVLTGIGLIVITLSVILFQVTKAAVANPTNNLRSE